MKEFQQVCGILPDKPISTF